MDNVSNEGAMLSRLFRELLEAKAEQEEKEEQEIENGQGVEQL